MSGRGVVCARPWSSAADDARALLMWSLPKQRQIRRRPRRAAPSVWLCSLFVMQTIAAVPPSTICIQIFTYQQPRISYCLHRSSSSTACVLASALLSACWEPSRCYPEDLGSKPGACTPLLRFSYSAGVDVELAAILPHITYLW